jgi:epoxyqueuosine reductase
MQAVKARASFVIVLLAVCEGSRIVRDCASGGMTLTSELKEAARKAGADLVGVADLAPFKSEGALLPGQGYAQFGKAISVAIHLDDDIVDAIQGAPTPEYARHYRAINATLDQLTAGLAGWIGSRGYSTFAVPASEILDKRRWLARISHKAVARMAGIGWQGKSLLIVSPQFGPRIRLSTVLTDMPLDCDQPLKNRCGTCRECALACPASAIKNGRTTDRYASRDEALSLSRCVERTLTFKSRADIGAQVCGVCFQACPFGRKRKRLGGRTLPF